MDIQILGADSLILAKVAKKYGMTGIGVKQNGPAKNRFIHLYNLGSKYTKLTGGSRPCVCSYDLDDVSVLCMFLANVSVCV